MPRSPADPAPTPHGAALDTPIGPVGVWVEEGAVVRIRFAVERGRPRDHAVRGAEPGSADAALLELACGELSAYFRGELRAFTLPLRPVGTPFQRAVWAALATVPYGETWSYGAIAARIGRPTAVRAVGAANGQNPLPIVIPCHRIVGATGSLTGFGGGLPAKAWLLAHERGRTGLFA